MDLVSREWSADTLMMGAELVKGEVGIGDVDFQSMTDADLEGELRQLEDRELMGVHHLRVIFNYSCYCGIPIVLMINDMVWFY